MAVNFALRVETVSRAERIGDTSYELWCMLKALRVPLICSVTDAPLTLNQGWRDVTLTPGMSHEAVHKACFDTTKYMARSE